jgi:hypothetical protein
MAAKRTRRRKGEAADGQGVEPAGGQSVKVTLRLSIEVAQRLGVEAAMRRMTQSAVAEEVLAPYLRRWRLPSTVDDKPPAPADRAGDAA